MFFRDNKMYLGSSALSSIHECKTQALLRNWHRLVSKGERGPLKGGHAGHTALEVYWKGGTVEDAMAALDDEYKEWATENIPGSDAWSYDHVSTIVRHYLETHPPRGYSFKVIPDQVELASTHPLPGTDDVVLITIRDAVVLDDDILYPLDHKFGGRVDKYWAKKFIHSAQLTAYLWASCQDTPANQRPDGIFINAIQICKLPSTDRRCSTHGTNYPNCRQQHYGTELIFYDRLPITIKQWRRTAKKLAYRLWDLIDRYPDLDDLPKVDMDGAFGGMTCANCDYLDFCHAGRPLSHIDSYLVEDPNPPFDPTAKENSK